MSAYNAAVEAAKSFQYLWQPRNATQRVLFVVPMHHYLNNMDRHAR